MRGEIDLREAINAVSDVVQNRPRPLREYDQIYMKTADMVLQSQLIADWADGRKLAFIGDGDAISVCTAYLQHRGIFDYGPRQIVVFDFDERITCAITRFADKERIENLKSVLYNCLDAFPRQGDFDCFYTNPPWGASNKGESVNVFVQRGMEAVDNRGDGYVVIADDSDVDWTKLVLARVQQFAAEQGFYVSKLMPHLHHYHLDDAPNLRSCNLVLASKLGNKPRGPSQAITDPDRLEHFYGKSKEPRVHYVRETRVRDFDRAHQAEYRLELLESEK